jgi:hypothetical protein
MQYAIELYFDQATEQKLFHLAKRVADEKLSTKFWNGKQDRTLHWLVSMMWMKRNASSDWKRLPKAIGECLHILLL